MSERFPLHIMIKPEGLEHFNDYIHSQIDLLELRTGYNRIANFRTVLTAEEIRILYPDESIPVEFKRYLGESTSEHFLLQGGNQIYEEAKMVKGKVYPESGVRGVLFRAMNKLGVKFEKWNNFLHASENINEAAPICAHYIKDISSCINCVAKNMCYGNLSGSAMPKTSLEP